MLNSNEFTTTYKIDTNHVIIGYGIKEIPSSAFYEWDIISAEINETVTSISYYAFESCSKLETITIGEGVETFGNQAFFLCSS